MKSSFLYAFFVGVYLRCALFCDAILWLQLIIQGQLRQLIHPYDKRSRRVAPSFRITRDHALQISFS